MSEPVTVMINVNVKKKKKKEYSVNRSYHLFLKVYWMAMTIVGQFTMMIRVIRMVMELVTHVTIVLVLVMLISLTLIRMVSETLVIHQREVIRTSK